MKTVIVTGATGQDGSYMIEYLLKNTDCNVVAAVRRTSQFIDSNLKGVIDNSRVRVIHFDLNDPCSITTTIKNEQPDYFINFGAQTFVADSWKTPDNHFKTNALGVLYILEAIKNFSPHTRGYFSGSSEQFGNVDYSPQDINHPMKPRSPYGVSKCSAQLLCKVYRESYGLYVIQGVLFNHESERRQIYFSTRKITHGVARIKKAIENKRPFEPISLGNIQSARDWSHSEDVIDGVWRMLNQEIFNREFAEVEFEEWPELYNEVENAKQMREWRSKRLKEYVLASGESHTVREFVELAFKYAGIEGNWSFAGTIGNYVPPENEVFRRPQEKGGEILMRIDPQFYRPAEVELLIGDSTPARKELGWQPKVSFKELVERMVKHDIALTNV